MTLHPSRVAVLTGDLVNSTAAGPGQTDAAIARIRDYAATAATWPGNGPDRFTRFRGDGWQFLVPRASLALRAVICLHAALRMVETVPLSRVSIGLGSIVLAGGGGLAAASGSALIASGQALDEIEKTRLFTIAGDGVTPLHHAVIDLVEDHVQRWTAEQAEASLPFLSPDTPTQRSIAEGLGISTQAVHARLKGAGAHAVQRAVEAWETQGRPYD